MFWCRYCRAEMPNYSPLLPNFCTNCRNWQNPKDDPHLKQPYIAPAQYQQYNTYVDHEDVAGAAKIIGFTVLLLPVWYFFSFKWYIILLIILAWITV
jgi:hypothetical protein